MSERGVVAGCRRGRHDPVAAALAELDVLVRDRVECAWQTGAIGPRMAGGEESGRDPSTSVVGQHPDRVEVRVPVGPGPFAELTEDRPESLDSRGDVGREERRRIGHRDSERRSVLTIRDSRTLQPHSHPHERVAPGVDPEPVNPSETPASEVQACGTSLRGGLIQTSAGTGFGSGSPLTKRSGWTA